MKKIIIAALALVLSLPSFAQGYGYGERHAKSTLSHSYGDGGNSIYYGLRLGLGLTTVNSEDNGLDGGSIQAGLNVGATIGFQLSPDYPIYLESGLMYMEKGGKGTYYGDDATYKTRKVTYSLNYLELPVLVKYIYAIDDEMSIQPFAGGYFALGVSGKVKNFATRTEPESSFSDDFFKRFDGGLRLGCGFQYQVLYGELAYEYGLANIAHGYFNSAHNSAFMINVGVNF